MMNTPNNGGPAFPQHGWSIDPETIERMSKKQGITIRDYFAAAALTGILANPDSSSSADALCHYAFVYADAMLAEREKKQ
jgi:hypothetical protein